MPQPFRRTGPASLLLSLALLSAAPALADLQAGRLAFFAGDYPTAFKEFNAAAEAGDSSGQYLSGEMLVQGRGIPKDARRGMALLEKAAASGHVGAQSLAGALYAFGQDLPADYGKALAHLRPAAQAGDMNAQNNLAALLYFGLGTRQDLVDALHWAKRAAAKRLVAAIKLEKEIESKATAEQIKEAEARVAQPLSLPVSKPALPPAPPPAPAAEPPAPVARAATTPSNAIPVSRPAPPPAAPATAPAGTSPAVPAPVAGWVIQVGSLPSREEAERHWKGIATRQASLLNGRQPTLVQADLGARGIYTRILLTGFPDQGAAAGLCAKLKAAGTDCLVRKGS